MTAAGQWERRENRMAMPCWIDLKLDTQIVGALLQVGAAALVAWYVQWKSNTDRKVSMAIAMDREWNTLEMVHARHMVDECLGNNIGAPAISGDYYEPYWLVRMFYIRLAELRRSKMIDDSLFSALFSRDATKFARKIFDQWGEKSISASDLAQIEAKRR